MPVVRFLISWGPALAWAGAIYYSSAQVWGPGNSFLPINDKVLHIISFSIFGGTLAWGARNLRAGRGHGLLILGGLLYAVTDEWHQAFVPTRTPSAGDWVADAVGLILGYVLILRMIRARKRRSNHGGPCQDGPLERY